MSIIGDQIPEEILNQFSCGSILAKRKIGPDRKTRVISGPIKSIEQIDSLRLTVRLSWLETRTRFLKKWLLVHDRDVEITFHIFEWRHSSGILFLKDYLGIQKIINTRFAKPVKILALEEFE